MIMIKSQFLFRNFTTDLSVSLPFKDNFSPELLRIIEKPHQMLLMCPVSLSLEVELRTLLMI